MLPIVWMAVLANLFQGWLGAMVSYKFSTVERAIADSFSLLLVYFLCDPLLNSKDVDDALLNIVAFIVPLSAATFMAATAEIQWLFETAGLDIGGHKKEKPVREGLDAANSETNGEPHSCGFLEACRRRHEGQTSSDEEDS